VSELLNDPSVKTAIVGLIVAAAAYVTHLIRQRTKRLQAEKDEANHSVESCVSMGQMLMPLLIETRLHMKADRIVMYQFHNGTVFLTSEPSWKMTPTYQSSDTGISPTHSMSDTASIILDLIEPMATPKENTYSASGVYKIACEECGRRCDNRTVYVFDGDSMVSGGWKTRMNLEGMKWTICTQIRNAKGRLVGVLSLEYRHEPDEADVKRVLVNFCEAANSIAAILARRTVENG